jgi:hypothetical protein
MKNVSAQIAYTLYCAGAYLPHKDHLCIKLNAMSDSVRQAHPSQAALNGTVGIFDSETTTVGDEILCRITWARIRRYNQLSKRRDALRSVFEADSMYAGAPC